MPEDQRPTWTDFYALDARLRSNEEFVARLDERSASIKASIDALSEQLAPLKDAVNRGRGGFAMLMILSNLITAGISGAVAHFFGK